MEPETNPEIISEEQKRSAFETLHTVTPLSKYLAMALFIILPFFGAWIGYTYAPEKGVDAEKVQGQFNEPTSDATQLEKESRSTGNQLDYNDTSINVFTYPDNSNVEEALLDQPLEVDARKVIVNQELFVSDEVNEVNFNLFNGDNYLLMKEKFEFKGCMDDPQMGSNCANSRYVWHGKDKEGHEASIAGTTNSKVNVIGTLYYIEGFNYSIQSFPKGGADYEDFNLLVKIDPSQYADD